MSIGSLAKKAERILADNSPFILTAVGVTGTITTAILAGRASFRAADILRDAELIDAETGDPDLPTVRSRHAVSTREKLEKTYKLYLPAVAVGSLTIAAIVGANRIGTRRAAAVAAAYSISERAFDEYRSKVVEKFGENKAREVREEIAQDRVNRKEAPVALIVSSDDGKVLCHDQFTNQYFRSDMETLRRAQNDVNAQILHQDFAKVSDFYEYVNAEGLEQTSFSDDVGWNTDKMLELTFDTILYQDKTPCLSVGFAVVPIREPWRFV